MHKQTDESTSAYTSQLAKPNKQDSAMHLVQPISSLHGNLDGSQKEEGDGGHCQVQNEPPEGQAAGVRAEQAVRGKAAASQGRKGKAGGAEDPFQGVRGGDVDLPNQRYVLQPQRQRLQHCSPRSSFLYVTRF